MGPLIAITRPGRAPVRAAILCVAVLFGSSAVAQDAPVPSEEAEVEEPGRAAFRAGVDAAGAEDWEAAAGHFERAFAASPRVAAAFNLVIAYEHLGRPVAVVEMADRMLAMADAVRHETQRLQVLALRERAIQRLVELRLSVDPPSATVQVDGQERPGSGPERTVWLEPGPREVHVTAPGRVDHVFSLEAQAGARVERDVRLEPEPSEADITPEPDRGSEAVTVDAPPEPGPPPAPQPRTEPRSGVRDALGLSLGGLGALSLGAAVVLQVGATLQAHDLEDRDPRQAGFLSATETYRRWRGASIALSLAGGFVTAGGALVSHWRLPAWARWWTLAAGAALTVGGAVLALRTPERIGETTLTHPDRALGALLAGLGTPLVVAPLIAFADPGEAAVSASVADGVGIGLRGRW